MSLIDAITSFFSALTEYYNNMSTLFKVIIIGIIILIFIFIIFMIFGRGNTVYIVEGKRRHRIESESNEDIKEAYEKRKKKEVEEKSKSNK